MGYLEDRLKRKNGILPPLPTKKDKKPIPKMSEKKKRELDAQKEARGGDDSDLVKWFKARIRYSMKGVCEESGLKTDTGIYKYAIMSCCHILEKRNCPSVKYHPLNFLELIPDLHFKWDNSSWEERQTWACWPVVEERLIMVYPDLAPEERMFFPEKLRNKIENLPFGENKF